MRNSTNYLRLWQQKRSELQIHGDPRSGWFEMQALLDVNMPVGHHAPGKFLHITKFKWLYMAIAATSTAAIIYFTLHHPFKKTGNRHHHKIEFRKDSATNRSINGYLIKNGTNGDISVNTKAINSSPVNPRSVNNLANVDANVTPGAIKNSNPIGVANIPVSNRRSSVKNSVDRSSNKVIQPVEKNNDNRSANAVTSSSGRQSKMINTSGLKLRHNSEYNNSSVSNYKSVQAGKGRNRLQNVSQYSAINTLTPVNNKSNVVLPVLNNTDRQEDITLMAPSLGKLNFSFNINTSPLITMQRVNTGTAEKTKPANTQTTGKEKDAKTKSITTLAVDWGILAGLNLPGSLTPKAQNTNFYGHLPADAFLGLFATYNAGSKWAVNMQIRLLNPHLVSGSYTHANNSKIDTNQTLQITDSRKIYTADVPVHLLYKVTNSMNIKAGPVISVPLKQANGNSNFQTNKARKDTTGYYNTVTNALNNTGFEKKINFGLSAGIGLDIKRLSIDATYYRGMQTQKVSSALGHYTANTNAMQLTIGFKLNKGRR